MGRKKHRVSHRSVKNLSKRLTEAEKFEKQRLKNERLKLQIEAKRLLAEQSALDRAQRQAVRQEVKAGPAPTIVQVQPRPVVTAATDGMLNPYMSDRPTGADPVPSQSEERPYTVAPDRDGQPVKTYDLPVPEATPPKPEEPGTAPANPIMPVWVQENRTATKAEWIAHQRARFHPPDIYHSRSGNTVSEETGGYFNGADVSSPNGVRLPAGGSTTLWNRSLKDL